MKPRVLNVAEKPSVAKGITEILGGPRVRRIPGLSKFNPVFEFDFSLNGEEVTMVITSVAGHLQNIDFQEQYTSWYKCDPSALFGAPIRKFVPTDKTEIANTLQREARIASQLVLWLDCDREGEAIGFEVIEVCSQVNSRLRVLRARFSAVGPRDIQRAVRNLVQPNQLDAAAVEARQEIDLRIGAAFTRWQTLRLRNRFDRLPDNVISYGPCQFPTLGFVVDRFLRILGFIPEQFWTIDCSLLVKENSAHRDDALMTDKEERNGITVSAPDRRKEMRADFYWKRGRLFDRLSCLVLYEMCVENPEATVTSVQQREKRRSAPLPLNTVELQKLASRTLRIGAEQTMVLAEKLYNEGYISYPRTETDNFASLKDEELHALIDLQKGDSQWGNYAQRLLNGEYKRPRSGRSDDKAHPPIHPTKSAGPELDKQQRPLYELIVRHFLACCSEDAIGQQTVVNIDIAGEEFTTRGLMITNTNYLDVYTVDHWSDTTIPVFTSNQRFVPTSLLMRESSTMAPPLLSEYDLISMMDRNGIGTDATIAQHIKTIQDRGYATKNAAGQFEPSSLGLALVRGYDNMGFELSKPHLRAVVRHS